jgi:hypothetical protein
MRVEYDCIRKIDAVCLTHAFSYAFVVQVLRT